MKWIYVVCLVVVAVSQAVRSQPRPVTRSKPPGLPPTATKRGSRPKDAPPPRITKNNNSAWKGIPPPPGSQNRFNPYNNPSYNQYGTQYQLPYAQNYWQQQQYGPQGGRPGYNQYNQQFNRIPHVKPPPPKVDPNINADMYLTLDKHPPILTRSNTPGSGRKIASSKQANKKPKGTTPPPTSPPTGTAPTTYPADWYEFSSTMATDGGTTTTEATTTTTRQPRRRPTKRRPTTRRPTTQRPTTRRPTTQMRTTTTRPQPTTVKVKAIPNHFGYDNSKPNSAPIPRPPPTRVPFVKSPTTAATVINNNYNNKAFDISPWNQDPAQTGLSGFNNVAANTNNKQSYQSANTQMSSVNAVQSANKAQIDSVALKPMETASKGKTWLAGGSAFRSSSTDQHPGLIGGTDTQRTLTSNVASPAIGATEQIANSKPQNDLAFDYGGQSSNTETKFKTSFSSNTMDNANNVDAFVQKPTTGNIKHNAQREFTRYGKDVLEGRKFSTKSNAEPTLSRADKSSVQNRNYQSSNMKSPIIGNAIYSTDTQSKRTLGGLDVSGVNEFSREFRPSPSIGSGVSLTESKNLPISDTSLLNSRSSSANTHNLDMSTFDRSSIGGSFSTPNEDRLFGQQSRFGSLGGTRTAGSQTFDLGSKTQSSLELSMMPDTKSFVGQTSNKNDVFSNIDRTPFDKSSSLLSGSFSSTNGKGYSSLDINVPSSFDSSYDRSLLNSGTRSNDLYMPNDKLTAFDKSSSLLSDSLSSTNDKLYSSLDLNGPSSLDLSYDRSLINIGTRRNGQFKPNGKLTAFDKSSSLLSGGISSMNDKAYSSLDLNGPSSLDLSNDRSFLSSARSDLYMPSDKLTPTLDSSFVSLETGLGTKEKRITTGQQNQDYMSLDRKIPDNGQPIKTDFNPFKSFDSSNVGGNIDGQRTNKQTFRQRPDILSDTANVKPTLAPSKAIESNDVKSKPKIDRSAIQELKFRLELEKLIRKRMTKSLTPADQIKLEALKQEYKVWKQIQANEKKIAALKADLLPKPSPTPGVQMKLGGIMNEPSMSQNTIDSKKKNTMLDTDKWNIKPTLLPGSNGKTLQRNTDRLSNGNMHINRESVFESQQAMPSNKQFNLDQTSAVNTIKHQRAPQFDMKSFSQQNLYDEITKNRNIPDSSFNPANNAGETSFGNTDSQRRNNGGQNQQAKPQFMPQKQENLKPQFMPQVQEKPFAAKQTMNPPMNNNKNQQMFMQPTKWPPVTKQGTNGYNQQSKQLGTATNEQTSFNNPNLDLSAAQKSKFQQQAIQKQFNQQVKSAPRQQDNQNGITQFNRQRDTNFDSQSFNGQMGSTNNDRQANNGQFGNTDNGGQANNRQFSNTNNGGQSYNGQTGSSNNGGQANNRRFGNTDNGGQSFNGQMGNTNNVGQSNNGQFGDANNGGQVNNRQFGNTDNGGQSFNGQMGNTNNGGQANNGRFGNTNNGGPSNNGRFGNTDNGGQSNNGQFGNINNSGQANNGQFGNANIGGQSNNGQLGNTNNGGQANHGRFGDTNNVGQSNNGRFGNTNNVGQSNNGQFGNTNTGGMTNSGQFGTKDNGGQSNNGHFGNTNTGGQSYNGHFDNTDNGRRMGKTYNGGQSTNGQWDKTNTGGQANNGQNGNTNMGLQQYNGLSRNANNAAQSLGSANNNVQSYNGQSSNNGAQTFNNNWGSSDSSVHSLTRNTDSIDNGASSVTGNNINSGSQASKGLSGYENNNGYSFSGQISHTDNSAKSFSGLSGSGNHGSLGSGYTQTTTVGPGQKKCSITPVCGTDGFTYMSDCFIWPGGAKACDGFCPCGKSSNSTGKASPTRPSLLPVSKNIPTTRSQQNMNFIKPTVLPSPAAPLVPTQPARPLAPAKPSIPECNCPKLYRPVCGVKGTTYNNDCVRRCNYDGFKCQGKCPCDANRVDHQSDTLSARPKINTTGNKIMGLITMQTTPSSRPQGLQYTVKSKQVRRGKINISNQAPEQVEKSGVDNRQPTFVKNVNGRTNGQNMKTDLISNRKAGYTGQVPRTSRAQESSNNYSGLKQSTGKTKPTRLIKGSRPSRLGKHTNTGQTDNSSGFKVGQSPKKPGFSTKTETGNRSGNNNRQGSRPNGLNNKTKSGQTENTNGSNMSLGSKASGYNKLTKSGKNENRSGKSMSQGSRANGFNRHTKSKQTQNSNVSSINQDPRVNGFNRQANSGQTENSVRSSMNQGSKVKRFNKQSTSEQTENGKRQSTSQSSRANGLNTKTKSEQNENGKRNSMRQGSRTIGFNRQTTSEQTENGKRNSLSQGSIANGFNKRTKSKQNENRGATGRRNNNMTVSGRMTYNTNMQRGRTSVTHSKKPLGTGQGRILGRKSDALLGNNARSNRAQIGNGRTRTVKKPMHTGQGRQQVSQNASPLYGNNANKNAQLVRPPQSCHCSEVYAPVCGSDGVTYQNPCKLSCSVGVDTACTGDCPCETITTKPTYYCEDYCVKNYEPVCSVSGRTFGNECLRQCSMESKACNGECPCGQGVKTRHSQDTGPTYSPPVTDVMPTFLPSASSGIWMDPQNFNNEPSNQPLSTCECRPGDIDPVCTTTGETLWYGCQAICLGKKIACSSECPC